MRLLLVNRFGHRIGGIETYLQHLAPALLSRGHDIALLYQEPMPDRSEPIVPQSAREWCVATHGAPGILHALESWNPGAVFAHQLIETDLLRQVQARWSSIYFAHCYLGVCISGTKCWKAPHPRVCDRRFGWPCLLHYFPHRCGGWSPRVMWRLYQEQNAAQGLLREFKCLLTHSEHMRQEYLRHGFDPGRVLKIPFWVPGEVQSIGPRPGIAKAEPIRLLFLGRNEVVKGGSLLIDAVASLTRRLDRDIELTVAGEGPERESWRRRAQRAMSTAPRVRIRFPGWIGGSERDRALSATHVIVVPSVWPEPFGMSGIEGAFYGVPSVAFDVGGVSEWLEDGINGHLAPGDPPTPAGLCDALVRALADPIHYLRLCEGAVASTRRFALAPHLAAIESALETV